MSLFEVPKEGGEGKQPSRLAASLGRRAMPTLALYVLLYVGMLGSARRGAWARRFRLEAQAASCRGEG